MDASRVQRIREDMERADARRLQPHYIESFFHEAFKQLGGTAKQARAPPLRDHPRPAPVRNRDRLIGIGEPVLPRYERIAFEKVAGRAPGPAAGRLCLPRPPAARRRHRPHAGAHRDLLKRGTVLVDERDPALSRACCSTWSTPSRTRPHPRRRAPGRLQAHALRRDGRQRRTRHVHYAPYLDYRPLAAGEPGIDAILDRPECQWITANSSRKAQGYAIAHVVPEHLAEVRGRKLELIAKTEAAVKDRLTKEITYWDHRAEELKLQEQAGKPNARLNSGEARKRADLLQGRLQKRWKT
jgi:hypothetical protein